LLDIQRVVPLRRRHCFLAALDAGSTAVQKAKAAGVSERTESRSEFPLAAIIGSMDLRWETMMSVDPGRAG